MSSSLAVEPIPDEGPSTLVSAVGPALWRSTLRRVIAVPSVDPVVEPTHRETGTTSACASPENFDAEVGRKAARNHAVNQIWPLEGYLLKQRLSEA